MNINDITNEKLLEILILGDKLICHRICVSGMSSATQVISYNDNSGEFDIKYLEKEQQNIFTRDYFLNDYIPAVRQLNIQISILSKEWKGVFLSL